MMDNASGRVFFGWKFSRGYYFRFRKNFARNNILRLLLDFLCRGTVKMFHVKHLRNSRAGFKVLKLKILKIKKWKKQKIFPRGGRNKANPLTLKKWCIIIYEYKQKCSDVSEKSSGMRAKKRKQKKARSK